MKQKFLSTKKFVSDHRVGLAVTATSIAWLSLAIRNQALYNDFLKENDLFEKYYSSLHEI